MINYWLYFLTSVTNVHIFWPLTCTNNRLWLCRLRKRKKNYRFEDHLRERIKFNPRPYQIWILQYKHRTYFATALYQNASQFWTYSGSFGETSGSRRDQGMAKVWPYVKYVNTRVTSWLRLGDTLVKPWSRLGPDVSPKDPLYVQGCDAFW